MANDRYRYEQNRYRDQGFDGRDRDDDDGYIARRGFGTERSGYDRSRERGFGGSAGYGTEGRARDRREQDRFAQDTFGRGSRDYNDERGFFERASDEVRSWFGDDDAERRERDMRSGESHRGRGPKGYQRSDARILDDVNDRLTDDPHIDASNIEVSVSNREVTLSGTVNSRFEKRHAEDIAESVSGVGHVQNNLRVQQYMDAGMGGSMLSGAGAAGAGTTGAPDTNATGAGDVGAARRRTSGSSEE